MTENIANQAVDAHSQLAQIGQLIRARRKSFKITATAASQSAGISRVTLHRIEKGESSVSMGSYLSVLGVLDMTFAVLETENTVTELQANKNGWVPARIYLADYPQLKELAWHIQGVDELSAAEAHGVYERNERFLDKPELCDAEKELILSLKAAFEGPMP